MSTFYSHKINPMNFASLNRINCRTNTSYQNGSRSTSQYRNSNHIINFLQIFIRMYKIGYFFKSTKVTTISSSMDYMTITNIHSYILIRNYLWWSTSVISRIYAKRCTVLSTEFSFRNYSEQIFRRRIQYFSFEICKINSYYNRFHWEYE